MKWYKITLRLKSALVTPLMGDTLFGHICWGIRYRQGEQALADFLNACRQKPRLILSDGFPEGFLPRPSLKVQINLNMTLEEYEAIKKNKKIRYLPKEWFFETKFIFSEKSLSDKIKDERLEPFPEANIGRMHNSINRLSGTVLDDQKPFSVNETWYEADQRFDVYALSDMSAEKLETLFWQGLENGYGADASTGKGWLEVVSVDEETRLPGRGNRAMALGAFVPYGEKPTDLRADIFTKFGKLGGSYVHETNPFKKPLIMYAAGATMQPNGRDYCGSLVNGIHKLPHIVHHAYAPLVFFDEEVEK